MAELPDGAGSLAASDAREIWVSLNLAAEFIIGTEKMPLLKVMLPIYPIISIE